MNDQDLLRYSRHILLPEIDISGQQKLNHSSVLIIGAGGLGSPAAIYLATSGIGNLIICDHDRVDLTNIQRQILHNSNSIGAPKVFSARNTLLGINPGISINAINERIDTDRLLLLASEADVIIDASDNFDTRYQVNQVCVALKKPLVSGAVIRFEGQISVFDLRNRENPCYHCLFPASATSEDTPCSVMGVFAPLVGIIGCIQAAEAIKIILDIGENLNSRLQILNGLTMNWHTVKLKKDPACPVCQHPTK